MKVKAPPEAELLEASPLDDEDAETIDAREVSDDAETIDLREVSDDAETIDDREVADAAPSNVAASAAPLEEEAEPASALDELAAKPASKPIVPMYDEDLDDSPTVALSSPMSSPVPTLSALASRPPAPPASRPLPPLSRPPMSRPLAPPPSRAPSAPPSAVRLPPLAPPPVSRSSSPSLSAPAISMPVPPVPTVLSADASSSARLSSIPPVAETVRPQPPRRSKLPMFAAAAAMLALVGAGVVGGKALGFGSAKTGTIVVTAAGPGGKAVNGIKVFADGTLKCDTSPCRIEGLSTGAHFVHAEAPGYEPTAARAVSVESGNEAVLNIDLSSKTVAPKAEAEEPEAKKENAKPADDVAATSLDKLAKEADKPAAVATVKPALDKPVKDKVAKSDATKPEPAAAAKLNINSIPRANVVLDGRPLGMTPQLGVSVSPGSHTVVFVHPELGRKVASTSVKAGGTSSVGVRFQ